jgi:hypothetical protein
LLEERVRDTKKAVKQNFDYRYQADKRPWRTLGASVVVGYLIGRTIGHGSSGRSTPARQAQPVVAPQKATVKGAVIGAVVPIVMEFIKSASLRALSSRSKSSSEARARAESRVLTPFRDEPPHYPTAIPNKPSGER